MTNYTPFKVLNKPQTNDYLFINQSTGKNALPDREKSTDLHIYKIHYQFSNDPEIYVFNSEPVFDIYSYLHDFINRSKLENRLMIISFSRFQPKIFTLFR